MNLESDDDVFGDSDAPFVAAHSPPTSGALSHHVPLLGMQAAAKENGVPMAGFPSKGLPLPHPHPRSDSAVSPTPTTPTATTNASPDPPSTKLTQFYGTTPPRSRTALAASPRAAQPVISLCSQPSSPHGSSASPQASPPARVPPSRAGTPVTPSLPLPPKPKAAAYGGASPSTASRCQASTTTTASIRVATAVAVAASGLRRAPTTLSTPSSLSSSASQHAFAPSPPAHKAAKAHHGPGGAGSGAAAWSMGGGAPGFGFGTNVLQGIPGVTRVDQPPPTPITLDSQVPVDALDAVASQPEAVWTSGPWLSLCLEVGLLAPDPAAACLRLTHKKLAHNVAYVLNEGYHKKVPSLALLVTKINPTDLDAFVTLRDPTGNISAVLQAQVPDRFPHIQTGCALLLRDLSVYNPGPDTHYLNITVENVVRVWPPDTEVPPAADGLVVSFQPPALYRRIPTRKLPRRRAFPFLRGAKSGSATTAATTAHVQHDGRRPWSPRTTATAGPHVASSPSVRRPWRSPQQHNSRQQRSSHHQHHQHQHQHQQHRPSHDVPPRTRSRSPHTGQGTSTLVPSGGGAKRRRATDGSPMAGSDTPGLAPSRMARVSLATSPAPPATSAPGGAGVVRDPFERGASHASDARVVTRPRTPPSLPLPTVRSTGTPVLRKPILTRRGDDLDAVMASFDVDRVRGGT